MKITRRQLRLIIQEAVKQSRENQSQEGIDPEIVVSPEKLSQDITRVRALVKKPWPSDSDIGELDLILSWYNNEKRVGALIDEFGTFTGNYPASPEGFIREQPTDDLIDKLDKSFSSEEFNNFKNIKQFLKIGTELPGRGERYLPTIKPIKPEKWAVKQLRKTGWFPDREASLREGKKMKITRRQLRQIINEERMLFENEEHESELREFSRGRGGNNVRKSGAKIASAATQIGAEAEIQTGKMRATLYNIADFIAKVGSALSGLGSLDEGDNESMADSLPTVQDLRRLQKEIARLEK